MSTAKRITVKLAAARIMRVTVLTAVVLLTAHITGLVLTFGFGRDFVYGLVPLFNFALEQNIPTFYSTMLLLLSAALFFVLAKTEPLRHRRFVWFLLAGVFLFLSLDEFASIHELLVRPVRELGNTSGIFYFAWVIPYGIVVAMLAIVVLPVIVRLEHRFVALFFVSAGLYLGGALGIELLEGRHAERVGSPDLTYRLLQTVQETLEIAGLLTLIYTLLTLLKTRLGEFGLGFTFDE